MQEGEALQDLLGVGAHDALPQRPIGLHQTLEGAARHILQEDGESGLVRIKVRTEEANNVCMVKPLVQGELLLQGATSLGRKIGVTLVKHTHYCL